MDWVCRFDARPIALGVVMATAGAWGQEPFLTPDRYVAAVGGELRLSLRSSEPEAAAIAWPDVKWFFVRVAGTQENRGRGEVGVGGGVLNWPVVHAGVTMVGVDFAPVVETMPGDRLARLLADRTMVEAPPGLAERERVRVRRVRSVKTLVAARAPGAAAPDAATAVSKSGQAVEIRPLFDPTTTPVGSDIPLRMYIDGESFGKPKIVATHAGDSLTLGNGERSTLDLRITGPGAWRVEFVHAAALAGDPEADWVVYSATLTFEAPAAGEAGR